MSWTAFSYITSAATSNAFYSDSQFVGFGFSTSQTESRACACSQVFPRQSRLGGGAGARRSDSRDRGGRLNPDRRRDHRHCVRAIRHRRGVIAFVFESREGIARAGADGEASGHHPDGVADPRLRSRRPQGRVLVLPQFRAPSVRGARRGLCGAERGRRHRLVLDLRYNGGGLVDVAVTWPA